MNMWKKIKKIFTPRSVESENDDSDLEFVTFQEKDPIDVTFTKNFINGGGMFFYCEEEQETLENLKEIFDNEQFDEVVCFEDKLKSLVNRLGVKLHDNFSSELDVAFISCEYLVAFDGSIMLSSQQTKGRKQEDLPTNIIVYARPDQFTLNINEALQKLNSRKKQSIHTTTSIRGRNIHNVDASAAAKNIYLLLVEQS